MKKLLLSVLLLAGLAGAARADEPLLSWNRLSLAAGPTLRFQEGVDRQFLVGAQGAYQIVPHLSLSGTANYNFSLPDGVDFGKRFEYQLGLRLRVL